jgi:hypothetical protein
MNRNGAIYRGIAMAQLESVFGHEFTGLYAGDMKRVTADYIDAAFSDPACTALEYARLIGRGNLQAYADTLAAQVSR